MLKKFAVDLTPLKKYPDFRFLWSAGLISNFGSMITYVALPFQIKLLTGSYLQVGAIGLVELVPLIVFGLYGGVLADKVDRKKMIWTTEFFALFVSLTLFANSRLHHPHIILLFIVAGTFAAVDGLQRPSQDAILPRLIEHHDQPSASSLMSLRWQFGAITGPAVAGFLLATLGIGAGYLFDVGSYIISIALLAKVSSVPPTIENELPDFQNLINGIKYAVTRKDLLGTYVIDLAAMFFAMPNALFPFWADQLHSRWALGLFYAAGTIGAIVTTLTSGWMRTYRYHGRAIMLAAIGWGIAITLAGSTHSLAFTLIFLGLAGASDQVSALCRGILWNQSIPDEYRGRLAGIQLLSYSVGPLGGQMRAGSMAAWTNLRTSVVSGGLLCIGFVSLFSAALPDFRKYDNQTNKFAVAQKKIRDQEANNSQN